MKIRIRLAMCFTLLSTQTFSATIEDQAERLTTIVSALNSDTLNSKPGGKIDGKISFNLNLGVIPDFDKTVGTKQEAEDSAPAIPKPSLRFNYANFFIEVGGTPKISAFNVESQNFSTKVGYGQTFGKHSFSLWGSYNKGKVVADITNPEINSADELSYSSRVINLTYGYRFKTLVPFITFGSGTFDSELFIPTDSNTIDATHNGMTSGVGINYQISKSTNLIGEVNVVDRIVIHPRIGVNVTF